MLNRVVTITGFGLFLAVFALVGCSHTITADDGSKVTFKSGGKIESTDAKGNTATVTDNGQKVTVQSPDGKTQYQADNGTVKAHDDKGNSMEIGTGISEAELGLPFYPGSADTKSSIKSATDKGTEFLSVRTTSDDPAKVLAFYTAKLGKPATSMNSDSISMANWKSGKRTELLSISKDGASNKVTLTVVNEK